MGKMLAVLHYTAMAREAQGMHADVALRPGFDTDYGAYEAHPLDPRAPEPLDGELSADDAHDQAVTELLTTAEPAADWIAKACDCSQGRTPVDTRHIGAYAILECTSVPVLLALVLNGMPQQQAQAADRLAQLYKRAEGQWIGQRSAELIASNRVELGLADESFDDTDYGTETL